MIPVSGTTLSAIPESSHIARFEPKHVPQPAQKENAMSRIQLSQIAPDFEIEDFNGRKIRLADFKDNRQVVLVFNRGFV
jgi:hypothetical protein